MDPIPRHVERAIALKEPNGFFRERRTGWIPADASAGERYAETAAHSFLALPRPRIRLIRYRGEGEERHGMGHRRGDREQRHLRPQLSTATRST